MSGTALCSRYSDTARFRCSPVSVPCGFVGKAKAADAGAYRLT